jgi:molybdate transport system ATP-binding protein
VGVVGGEITSAQLAVRVRKTRTYRDHRPTDRTPFVLDVVLEIPPGITIVFGPSGAGKSTLLDCIAGLLRPEEGRISIGAQVLLDTDRGISLPPQKRQVAYVFQSLALFPHITVEQNVAYGLVETGAPERGARVNEALDAFRVRKFAHRKPDELSGGERQRAALARSLATSPHVLLLDEPLTALDAGMKKSIMDDLRDWNAAKNIPVLYVTHSREEVDALGERVIALEQGKMAVSGTPHEVLAAPRRSSLAQAAGFENLLTGTITELRESDGVMRVCLEESDCEIETPLGYSAVGDRVKLAIRAGDILLATEPPHRLSARNVIPGTIVSMEQRGATVIAKVTAGRNASVGESVAFTVHLTPGAKRTLGLEVDCAVWLVLKTYSCHVLDA